LVYIYVQETFTSTLELFGDPTGYSAMAWSVGITCGVATQLVLDGHPEVKKPGVWAPYTKEIGDVIREVLEEEGLKVVEEKVE
jgi:saccharopine dehydrogenase (NADP+, L-glutamate forming)